MKTVAEYEAQIQLLYDLAVQANQNCASMADYLRPYRPALAYIGDDWCKNIKSELDWVNNEN